MKQIHHSFLALCLTLMWLCTPLPAQAGRAVAEPTTMEGMNALLAKLDDSGRDYYWRSFNYMMERGSKDKPQSFRGNSFAATFAVAPSFTGRSGITCRRFSEILKIKGELPRRLEAMACRSQVGHWCKTNEKDKNQQCPEPAGLNLSGDALELESRDATNQLKNSLQSLKSKLHF